MAENLWKLTIMGPPFVQADGRKKRSFVSFGYSFKEKLNYPPTAAVF